MSQYKYAEIADTVYFWFAANLTTGAAGDGASPLYDVRLAGAAATLATGCLTADAFAADAIVAATLATGCITADALGANAITNAAVADDVDVNVKTITAGAITAAAIADGAIDAATFAADMDAEIATIVWNAAVASYGGAGTYGQAVEDALADTNELQGDWVNTGRLDTILDTINTTTTLCEDILRNKMEVKDATGNTVLYADDNSTPLYSVNGCLTDDSTTTTRLRLE